MRKMELGEHLYAFFHSQLLEKEAAMAFWVLSWWPGKKQVLFRHAWSFKLKNHYKSLLGPYEGKLQ
jgi:hypothetical protein